MQLSEKEFTDMLMGFITDHKACLDQIFNSLDQVSTIGKGMDTLQGYLESDPEKVDLPKAMLALIKSMRKLATHAQITGLLALVHVSDGDFDTEAALALNRLGKGQEAVKAMFEKKLRGEG